MIVRLPAFGLLEIGSLLAFIFLFTFDKLWRATLSPAFQRLGNVGFGGVHGIGAVHPLRFLHSVDTNVQQWTRNGLAASERGIVYSLKQLGDSIVLPIGVLLALALSLYELARYAKHELVPATTNVVRTTIVRPLTKTVTITKGISATVTRALTHRIARLEARVQTLAHAAAGTIAQPFPRIKTVERDLSQLGKRVKSLEKEIAVGLGAALLIRTLAKIGLGWLRCRNVSKAGKAVCGMNPSLLESLLLDTALLAVAFDLETFAKEVQAITGVVAGEIHRFAH